MSNTASTPLPVNLNTETPSVKIYDDGGKNHNNRYNCDSYLLLTAPEGYCLKLTGTMYGGALKVYDGSNTTTQLFATNTNGNTQSIGSIVSSNTQMLIRFFSNNSYDYYDGIDLTASLYNPNEQHSITLNNPTDGSGEVSASVAQATIGTIVTLNITSATGYALESLEVKDAENNIISTSNWTWYDITPTTPVTFTMPSSAVTVTPTFTDCPSIDIELTGSNLSKKKVVNIPAGLQRFKVYDDGGKDNNYSPSTIYSYTQFIAPTRYCMKVNGTVKTQYLYDELIIYDGDSNSDNLLLGTYSGTKDVGELFTTSNQLLIYFNGFDNNVAEGFELIVTVFDPTTQVTLDNDATDNSTTISNNDGVMTSVQLSNRTFYQDGKWNTICLPFDLTLAGSPLSGAIARTLTNASFDDGTLNLTFGEKETELTAGTPYLIMWEPADLIISTVAEWNTFATAVTGGTTYENEVVRLAADIDNVSNMAGTYYNRFKGTFDGNGHKLTVNLQADGEYCAPFRYVSGATIRNLHIAGTVSAGTNKYGAGLVDQSQGTVKIKNCRSSVTISSNRSSLDEKDGTHGGFVGVVNTGSVTMTNCLFDGSITDPNIATTSCGGFIGWHESNYSVTFENCLMAVTLSISVDENSATFTRNGDSKTTITNCYYKTALSNNGVNQGTVVGNRSDEQLANDLGSGWQVTTDGVVPRYVLADPMFAGVKISDDVNHQSFDLGSGKSITFKGTYDKLSYDSDTPSILFLGASNTLYWPQSGATIGACRAYFELEGLTAGEPGSQQAVRAFVLNFGDESTQTGIVHTEITEITEKSDAWYTLDGRKLDGVGAGPVPARLRKGLYIHNGRKVVIK